MAKMAFAQNGWISAGIPNTYSTVYCLFSDTIGNRLYAGGIILNPSFSNLAIKYYDGLNWYDIGSANNQTRSIIRYNSDIIVAGFFTKINGVAVNYIARFDGTNWYSFGNFNAQVLKVKIINNELYAMGSFTMIDSISCNSIAKWNGNSWQPVFNFPYIDAYVNDAEIYQGDLYVGGNSFGLGASNYDISVYKNGNWQMVGNGIQGFASTVDNMVVYKNELIVSGLIWRSAGNTGDGIQKWNGSNWSDLGMGLRTGTNPNTSAPHVHDMKIYNNELYIAGAFDYADSIPAKSLAKWDGEKWCNFPTLDFVSTNLVVDIYHDTIYTGCGYDTLNGDTINYLAKMLSLDPLGCRELGVENIENANQEFSIYPNPTNNELNINLNNNKTEIGEILIYNVQGILVAQENIQLKPVQNKFIINTKNLSAGVYFVNVNSSNVFKMQKVIKN
jgi:hypothetical protein